MTGQGPDGDASAFPESGARRCLGPTVAGTWYPADPRDLARQVDGFLDAARESSDLARTVSALIAPHAGFVYSGAVAGHGFAGLRGRRFRRVLLLGPSHYAAFSGAALPTAAHYRTPLGDVALERQAVETIAQLPGIHLDDEPFRREHCLEAEIPFLQRALAPEWRLVPVLLGAGTSARDAAGVADALRPFTGAETLIVVSSDFTHFGPRFRYVPFEREVPARVEQLDMGAVERIVARDRTGFEDYVQRTGATICGRDAIGVMLRLLPDDLEGSLAAYDTSGRITGSWDHSVSYASLVFGPRTGEAGAS